MATNNQIVRIKCGNEIRIRHILHQNETYMLKFFRELIEFEYVMNTPRSGSSHYTFRKQGCLPITIPKHEPIKKIYVEMVRQIVESEAEKDEDVE